MHIKRIIQLVVVLACVKNSCCFVEPQSSHIPDWLARLKDCLRSGPGLIDVVRDMYNDIKKTHELHADVIQKSFENIRTFSNECLHFKLPEESKECFGYIQSIEEGAKSYAIEQNPLIKSMLAAKLAYDLGEAFKKCYPQPKKDECAKVRSQFLQLTDQLKDQTIRESDTSVTTKQMIELLDFISVIC